MDYKKLNEALIDLSEYTLKRKYEQVLVKTPDDYFQEKNQSDTSLKTEIYKLDFDDLYLKVSRVTDSYGDNERLSSIQLVKPVIKQVTDFESI